MNLRGRNKVTPEFNMSSMTDIVFLLLIFFMLASTLVTTNAIDILLPKASGKTENKKSVAVSIKKDLTYYIDQKRVGESMLESELIAVLSNEEKPTLVLRAEKSVPVEHVVKVMDIANRNKFKVILAVKPN
ncbi:MULTISPECIES: ExbD/TolR family protein [Xanthomarina]|jgi:biopolymer transport protein ExbD|uniref:Biopolymer transport protein ExbD/TolR n=1 Tax=Xanthomarina gelatinilytica TaxID=1137281 RepID=M7MFB8_9FLAO|nr:MULTISPECIES: biopolymer transporter ExbD [Xanthomarina]MCB0387542.1 biopolymer transporter ExbD [Winogradskyella sp.]EMQ94927.1 Biopolymer transport protein ExbD/TolR [Xanthomarina gelatinilytica]MAL23815.1 biopolymer transporter ExbD [Xanthomarina sp.]MBF62179.1 biopolymer transporter ExbD [Xanthomarina sp.]MDX1317359.1 biopolymer transporter ExbD [Xanthomarina gelatinilytica]|tara:strand:- start:1296 stop:1688 length:393 start_codon:yes stop_codon:yes gene_type:complete